MILSLLLCLLILFSSLIPCFAIAYEDVYPDYVNISGGSYVTFNSSLGEVSFITSSEYKNNTFGFIGSHSDICNLTSRTIYGYLYSIRGERYEARLKSNFGQIEILNKLDKWTNITISDIKSTNINFVDDSNLNRQNDRYFFDKYQLLFLVPLYISCACSVFMLFKNSKRGG